MINRPIDIYEPDEIKAVFTFIKTPKTITDITENAGISTIFTSSLVLLNDVQKIYLQAGQIVTLNSINYEVLSVGTGQFTISATDLYTLDYLNNKQLLVTEWNLAVNFKFGTRIEVNGILDTESKDTSKKLMRFPLVWLFINEGREHDSLDYDYKTSLKMAFVHLSEVKYTAQQRLDNVFKKVLQPLESLFLATIQSPYFSDKFNFEYEKLTYTDYYRYFYGSSDKNKTVLDAPTDAIELDLDLNFQNQYD